MRDGDERRHRLLTRGTALVVGVVVGGLLLMRTQGTEQAGSSGHRWPRTMVAMGDSITLAVNSGFELDDGVRHSWALGADDSDAVTSHYERIRAANSALQGHNLAVSGARMRDAPRQARRAVAARPDYVTFLIGANDVCARSVRAMTPVPRFRRQSERAIKSLVRGLPEATIYVVSIPDVYRLWEILHTEPAATQSWRAFGTCQSLLAESNDEDDRQSVRRRVIEFNQVLEDVCLRYGSCRWDGGEVFRYAFERADVSALDYFHPSVEGQSRLAEVTWRHGPLAS